MHGLINAVSRFQGRLPILAIALFLASAAATGQISDKVSRVSVSTAAAGEPLTIQADLLQPEVIERVDLAYRPLGQTDFRFTEMAISGNSATATLPGSVTSASSIEYYLLLSIRGKEAQETFPIENPTQQPLRVDLQPASAMRNRIVILSPDRDERVTKEDLLITFSLLNADTTVDRAATKIYIDGADLSSLAVSAGDLYVLKPENMAVPLESGLHSVSVVLHDRQGIPVDSTRWAFTITGGLLMPVPMAKSPWLYNGSVQLETRNENIQKEVTPYNRATVDASGSYDLFRAKGHLYVTNEEKDTRQPQNRFFIGGESPWLNIGYGDNYPVFPDLIMNGRRVRGVTGNLTLNKFNLDITHGDIIRRIESDTIRTFPADSLAAQQARNPGLAYGLYDPATGEWAAFNYGTFNRDLTIIHPSFGERNGSHIGFTYLKSSDDPGSIRFGVRPEENVVFGSDLFLTYDRHNVEFSGQAALSGTNHDITSGTFSNAQIDSLYANYSESQRTTIRQLRDFFSRFITVNQNLVPLGSKGVPTLSYETALSLNYFNNYFRATYLRHGDSYESFGQTFLQPDIEGFNLADRVRLVENQLMLTAGIERLQDNTASTKPATTTSLTANGGVSYYPRTDLPTMTLSYVYTSNDNDRDPADSVWAISDKTNRVFFQLGKSFTYGIRHNALMSVSTSVRDDRTVRNRDTRNTAVTLSDAGTFTIPLQVTMSVTYNSSKFVMLDSSLNLSPITLAYTTIYATGEYRAMQDLLRFTLGVSPTFGDLQRVLIDAGAQYYFVKNVSARLQFSLYLNNKLFNTSTTSNDIIWGIVFHADV